MTKRRTKKTCYFFMMGGAITQLHKRLHPGEKSKVQVRTQGEKKDLDSQWQTKWLVRMDFLFFFCAACSGDEKPWGGVGENCAHILQAPSLGAHGLVFITAVPRPHTDTQSKEYKLFKPATVWRNSGKPSQPCVSVNLWGGAIAHGPFFVCFIYIYIYIMLYFVFIN